MPRLRQLSLILAAATVTVSAIGQTFPAMSDGQRISMLAPPAGRPVKMVFDTDTYNEIDDQFALVYALISSELDVQAVYAAPFENNRSTGPGNGMEKSYEEILRILDKLYRSPVSPARQGRRALPFRCIVARPRSLRAIRRESASSEARPWKSVG